MSIELLSLDTFLLTLTTLFTAIIIPLIRNYFKRLSIITDRIEMLEFIAIHQHPDLVIKFKELKSWNNNFVITVIKK